MERVEIKSLFEKAETYGQETITVCGWVKTMRNSKALGFIELSDGSSFQNLQVVFGEGKVEKLQRN